ncbi:MAG: ferredoxin-thioredoxin reductase catalytic domain-containing protein [Dethiobacteria bacterium]
MKSEVFCPVCEEEIKFKDGVPEDGTLINCAACGSRLEVKEQDSRINVERLSQPREEEIRGRIDVFARLQGFKLSERKEKIIAGLIRKYEKFGDFYCPCRLENITDNICPCKETRMNILTKDGGCHCGLFYKEKI